MLEESTKDLGIYSYIYHKLPSCKMINNTIILQTVAQKFCARYLYHYFLVTSNAATVSLRTLFLFLFYHQSVVWACGVEKIENIRRLSSLSVCNNRVRYNFIDTRKVMYISRPRMTTWLLLEYCQFNRSLCKCGL